MTHTHTYTHTHTDTHTHLVLRHCRQHLAQLIDLLIVPGLGKLQVVERERPESRHQLRPAKREQRLLERENVSKMFGAFCCWLSERICGKRSGLLLVVSTVYLESLALTMQLQLLARHVEPRLNLYSGTSNLIPHAPRCTRHAAMGTSNLTQGRGKRGHTLWCGPGSAWPSSP